MEEPSHVIRQCMLVTVQWVLWEIRKYLSSLYLMEITKDIWSELTGYVLNSFEKYYPSVCMAKRPVKRQEKSSLIVTADRQWVARKQYRQNRVCSLPFLYTKNSSYNDVVRRGNAKSKYRHIYQRTYIVTSEARSNRQTTNRTLSLLRIWAVGTDMAISSR